MIPTPHNTRNPSITASATADIDHVIERRNEARSPVTCDLWMIDHQGSTVLRCRCLEVAASSMRLRVPLGYGVAEGQRYELRSHLPGAPAPSSLGLVGSRWATVVRTRLCLEEDEDHIDIGVILDADTAPLSTMPS